jgi:hypothetical protein
LTYTVNSATQITATDPAGTGTVDVTVTTIGGTSQTNANDHFTYAAVTSVYLNGDFAPIVAIGDSSGTITAVTDGTDNGFAVGNSVVLGGFTGSFSGYNGTYTIATTPASNEFTFTGTSGLPTSSNTALGYAISQNNAPTTTSTGLENRQRSMVDSVAYTFSAAVNLNAAQFSMSTLTPTASGPATPATEYPGLSLTSLNGGLTWVATWVSGGGTGATTTGWSLADGVYQLTLANSGRSTDTFYRLFGQIFGGSSVKVFNQDVTQFCLGAYLQVNGSSGYQAGFDYNGSGSVNNTDVGPFNARYFTNWSGFTPTI